jgi:HlyD family secretion protein
MKQGRESLDIERNILNDIEPLGEEGAIARYQINKQKQSVTDRQNELQQQEANGKIDQEKQEKEVQTRIAEISRLEQEEKRYSLLISQAQEKLINTTVITEKDVPIKWRTITNGSLKSIVRSVALLLITTSALPN